MESQRCINHPINQKNKSLINQSIIKSPLPIILPSLVQPLLHMFHKFRFRCQRLHVLEPALTKDANIYCSFFLKRSVFIPTVYITLCCFGFNTQQTSVQVSTFRLFIHQCKRIEGHLTLYGLSLLRQYRSHCSLYTHHLAKDDILENELVVIQLRLRTYVQQIL